MGAHILQTVFLSLPNDKHYINEKRIGGDLNTCFESYSYNFDNNFITNITQGNASENRSPFRYKYDGRVFAQYAPVTISMFC